MIWTVDTQLTLPKLKSGFLDRITTRILLVEKGNLWNNELIKCKRGKMCVKDKKPFEADLKYILTKNQQKIPRFVRLQIVSTH